MSKDKIVVVEGFITEVNTTMAKTSIYTDVKVQHPDQARYGFDYVLNPYVNPAECQFRYPLDKSGNPFLDIYQSGKRVRITVEVIEDDANL